MAPTAALAHDTWLEQRPGRAGQVELALSTGALFPAAQTGIAAASLVDRGCLAAPGRRLPLRAGAALASALTLHTAPRRGETITACWVQTEAFDVEVPAALVPTYLREIAAPDSIRQAWAEQQGQGLPWRERYTKHARISWAAPAAAGPATHSPHSAQSPRSSPPPTAPAMALDIEIEDARAPRAGETLRFRVLRDGQALAGQAVELRGEMSRFGLWRRTDAEGRASVPVPFAGRWVLRATDLRALPGQPGHWQSRFVTHAFSAAPAVPAAPEAADDGPIGSHLAAAGGSAGSAQPSNPSMPKARSANQSKATPTISTEPPVTTARR
ncbi:MAG: DUF4198 domain-containing protein [Burkholderiales bacterium]|nr:DUF4198 domain-containing protein [Burkholderiales bacterium]